MKSETAPWTLDMAILPLRLIEAICPRFDCHVALTGGVLYKNGPRKDLDLIFYRIRQAASIDRDGLIKAMVEEIGFSEIRTFGWMNKAIFRGMPVDLLFPEHVSSPDDAPGYTS